MKIKITFKKEKELPFDKFEIDTNLSEVLSFLDETEISFNNKSFSIKKKEVKTDYGLENNEKWKSSTPEDRIRVAIKDKVEIVKDLIKELNEVLHCANDVIPRRALNPYNRLALLFNLPALPDLKPKKGMSPEERAEGLKFLNESFRKWLGWNYKSQMSEVEDTKLVIGAFMQALNLIGSSN